jgi:phage minor structural protein
MWIIDDGQLVNTDHVPYEPRPLIKPVGGGVWHIEGLYNSGYPFCDLMIGIPHLRVKIVDQDPYISVYDISCEREDFNNNGLAILCPSECRVHEVLNGEYSVTMKHPMDEDGKWKLLLERNYLKVLGQIFTIVQVTRDFQAHTVDVTAEHVFYQLADGWIFPAGVGETEPPRIAGSSGEEVLRNIMMMSTYYAGSDVHAFLFQYGSDMENISYIQEVTDGMTPVAAILGGNGLCEVTGGKLLRDNFYFSVNNEMEDSDNNAFDLRVGNNLHGIQQTVDVQSMCSYLRVYGNGWMATACSWAPGSFPIRQIPHNIVRSVSLNIAGLTVEALSQYMESYFWRYCQPIISYKFNIADSIGNPIYDDISKMYRYKVGDKGTITDDRLGGTVYLEITETWKDGITGRTLSFSVGNRRSFTRPANIPAEVHVAQIQPEMKSFVWRDKNGLILKDKNGAILYTEVDLNNG